MCGLTLLARRLGLDRAAIEAANRRCQRRGPDKTTAVEVEGHVAVHNTLFITGRPTPQPLWLPDARLLVLFNGEIYNYRTFGEHLASDALCIPEAYRRHGPAFARHLDGEFAIVLLDFKANRFVIATDPFGTKPLWWNGGRGGLAVSSYGSALAPALKPVRFPPNTIRVGRVDTATPTATHRTRAWDLTRQRKTSYDDWFRAFVRAIEKRAQGAGRVFVCLSGGYDSGAICAVLNHLGIPYTAHSIVGDENQAVVRKRIAANRKAGATTTLHAPAPEVFAAERAFLAEHSEDRPAHVAKGTILRDKAAAGLSFICRTCRADGVKITLSGQGADEIMSDYAVDGRAIYKHSCFAGVFPPDLRTLLKVDPEKPCRWKSFYGGTQRDYIDKEEFVTGAHGIEGRYPFLDADVVQEFLWLTPELKNRAYKAPLADLFRRLDYAYDPGHKVGFRIVTAAKE